MQCLRLSSSPPKIHAVGDLSKVIEYHLIGPICFIFSHGEQKKNQIMILGVTVAMVTSLH